jgi:hypothetical protein
MTVHSIVSTQERHFESLYQALDTVAREKKYLAQTQAPPWQQSLAFYRNVLAEGFPHVVAVDAGDRVVGWCDVSPVFGHSRAHIGLLGIALLPEGAAGAWARSCCRRPSTGRGRAGSPASSSRSARTT